MIDLRREIRRGALLVSCALSMGAAVSAQGYYDEEEWWDVTEWFDGNDYEYHEYGDDDDRGYDADEGWNDPYGYGYDARYDGDDWFYDYYDGVYSTYTDYGDGVYGYATRYYDFDDDGFFDAYYTYNDWDGDGFYEDVDYHAIDGARERGGSSRSAQRASDESQDSKRSAQRQREASTRFAYDGKIVKKKKTSVRDTKHLVVELETRSGERVVADLGPVGGLDDLDLVTGDRIRVRGPKTTLGEHDLLIAKEVAPDGGSLRPIERETRCVKGHVADTRKAQLDGQQRLLAIVRTDARTKDSEKERSQEDRRHASDKKWLVDLGPASALDVKLSKGQAVEVRGIPCKKDDRRILVATRLVRGDDEVRIDRRPAMRPMSPARSSASEAGYENGSSSSSQERDTR